MKREAGGIRLLVVAAALLAAGLLFSCSKAGERKPSVILIVIDTLRTDVLGCYGSDLAATPGLDAFADEGVLFEAAYSQSPWTLPSFATLFTSTYPGEHGARGSFEERFYPVRKDLTTAAESFKAQGYRTAAVVNNIFLKADFGFRKGFDHYDFYPAEIFKIRKAGEVTGLALRWLDDHGSDGEPYFLFLHYYDPHFAYRPPSEMQNRFGGKHTDNIKRLKDPVDLMTGKVSLNSWDKESLRKLYHGEVAYTDQEVKRLLDLARKKGYLDDAVVVITADHGEEFWDHGGFEHGHTQYDEVVKVPLLFQFPDGKHKGRRIDRPVRLMDVMPTLYEFLGFDPPATFRGKSFLSLIKSGGAEYREPLYFEGCLYGSERKALRVNNLKLIYDTATGACELYDLSVDPGELNDLAARKPDETEKFKTALLQIMENLSQAKSNDEAPADLSPEMLKILQELGYASR